MKLYCVLMDKQVMGYVFATSQTHALHLFMIYCERVGEKPTGTMIEAEPVVTLDGKEVSA